MTEQTGQTEQVKKVEVTPSEEETKVMEEKKMEEEKQIKKELEKEVGEEPIEPTPAPATPAPAAEEPIDESELEEEPEEPEPEETQVKKANPNTKPAKVTLADMEDFKACIATISELVTEATIVLDKEGFSIVAMDPANVAMVVYKASSSAFTLYDVPETTESCINMNNFKQFLKRGNKETILELTFTEKVHIKMTKGNRIKTFTLPVLDVEEAKQKMPELQHAATVTMETKEFAEILLDAELVAESVKFAVESEGVMIESQGDLSTYRNDNMECSISCKEKCESKYALEYLKKMVNAKMAKDITMKIGKDYPLMLEYETATAGKMIFILAPRSDR